MVIRSRCLSRFGAAVVFVCAISLSAQTVPAAEITFRSFSASAAIGPPADDYAAKLAKISEVVLGQAGQVKFTKQSPTPAIPPPFKDIMAAVAAGGAAAGGTGFDAAYISGSELNRAWGFIYNSGVPFGPNFDEFIGFLYGKSIGDGKQTGLELLQAILRIARTSWQFPLLGAVSSAPGTSCCRSAMPGPLLVSAWLVCVSRIGRFATCLQPSSSSNARVTTL